MTKSEYIATHVETRMSHIRVERVHTCSLDGCSTPATHVSLFDGSTLCPSHVEAYETNMRAFFTRQARALADKYFKDETDDEQKELRGA